MDVTKGPATAESQIGVALRVLVEGGTVTGTIRCSMQTDSGLTFGGSLPFEVSLSGPIAPGTPFDTARTVTIMSGNPPPSDLGSLNCQLTGTDQRGGAVTATQSAAVPNSALQPKTSTCTPGGSTLCAFNNRFKIEATWRNASGASGSGTVAPNGRYNDGGYFWFFDDRNTETLVQVLNRCNSSPSRYWVFASGLTNVEVNVTVTDTQAGVTQTYTNPQGQPFRDITDTGAFATCP
ncbi:MAG: hypothetical protein Q8O42_07070 [Acidobacteriota bacterium]|nr:hypothetical protein [Acidobacteriota bacterium]